MPHRALLTALSILLAACAPRYSPDVAAPPAVGVTPPAPTAAAPDPLPPFVPPQPPAPSTPPVENAFLPPPLPATGAAYVLERLNQIRQHGATCPGGARIPAGFVKFNAVLTDAARDQAAYIANSGRITHSGTDGTSPRDRVRLRGAQVSALSEIIYLHRNGDDEAAVRWWLASPVHCAVIMDGRYEQVGASVTRGAYGTAYVALLAKP